MRELVLALAALAALAMGLAHGPLADFLAHDDTYLVYAIAGLSLAAHAWRPLLRFLTEHQVCPMLGLLGTVLGILGAMKGLSGIPGPEQLSGAFTALSTTAAGIVAHVWLTLVRELTR